MRDFKQIHKNIENFEHKNKVSVIFASNNGSHAWGYATEQSDYDVKLLYVHPQKEYKKLWEPSDHILYKPDEMHDYTAWDIKKLMHLLWKGNAQVYELFFSNEIYVNSKEAEDLKEFSENVLKENLQAVAWHYWGLAYKTFKEHIAGSGETTLKKYFYVMRPLLHVESMIRFQSLPSLVFSDVLDEASYHKLAPGPVLNTTRDLLKLKRDGNLTKPHDIRPIDLMFLDGYISGRLEELKPLIKISFPADEKETGFTTTQNFNNYFEDIAFGDDVAYSDRTRIHYKAD